MAKIGILLSGCGVKDGSEIHEAVLTMLALDRLGVERLCLAPNVAQSDVVNHFTGESASASRNVLVESARIARGEISDLAKVSASDMDALILPGGFGAAKNLCDFAVAGVRTEVYPEVSRLLWEMHEAKKPIGAICIAPVVIARVFGGLRPKVTIGNDLATAKILESFGAQHQECPVDDIVVDQENRLVTTPAYMLGPGLREIASGIEKLVHQIVAMAA
ncbi:MAG: isoprenoid biosynthesis glyoxalase ElbB [Deltaproteobacteria bacterium]|nr:isoprenoid biosynthesis glyoxalase ElbB [Deltaproteobacteria bacterium]